MSLLKRLTVFVMMVLLAFGVFWTMSQGSSDFTPLAKSNNPAPAPTGQTQPGPYPLPTTSLLPQPTRALPAYPIVTPTALIPALTPPTPYPTITLRPTLPNPAATLRPPVASQSVLRYATVSGEGENRTFSYQQLLLDPQNRLSGPAIPVSLPGALTFNPYEIWPSPNGEYSLVMQYAETGGVPYVVHHRSNAVRPALKEIGAGQFYGWHPDGRRFLFWVYFRGMWLVDAETQELTTLAQPEGPIQGAAISPDGGTIAFIGRNMPATRRALWLVSSSGGDAGPLLDLGGSAYMYPHAWSPDGKRIVFYGGCSRSDQPTPSQSSGGGQGYTPFCIVDVTTRKTRSLNLPGDIQYEPNWSPDGRFIAATGFSSTDKPCSADRDNGSLTSACLYSGRRIYLADLTANTVQDLGPGLAPVWSPDGSKLSFLSNQSGRPEVWITDIATRDVQQLTNDSQSKNPRGQLLWKREVK
jgi:Tol biopolymer transport system component